MKKLTERKSAAPLYALGAAALLAGAWAAVQYKTRKVEQDHPPQGDFVTVDGVQLHYISQGVGEPLVLLHGNGVTAEDFRNSGLLAELAKDHYVIAFDRPGFGYSERPRSTVWTPEAQARLFARALDRMGVPRALVVAHSWATMVALEWARVRPEQVTGLVLAGGYYYPSARADVLLSTPAIPILGDLLRYTVSPLLTRLIWPLAAKRAFHPNPVPASFARFPKWMALRPGQLRAEAAETMMMIPMVSALQKHYADLKLPVAIVAGIEDKIATCSHNAERLRKDIAHSELVLLPHSGHMLQHVALPELAAAVRRIERQSMVKVEQQPTAPARPQPAPPQHTPAL